MPWHVDLRYCTGQDMRRERATANVAEWLLDRQAGREEAKKVRGMDGSGTDVSPSLGLSPHPGGSPSEARRGPPTTWSPCVVRRPSLG